MMTNIKGFSLIELMIVVAIIGILTMIAYPSYQDYVTKTKVAEAISLAGSYKSTIVEFTSIQDSSKCPTNRETKYLNNTDEVKDPSLPSPLQFGNKNIHAMIFGKSSQSKGTCGIWIQFGENNPRGLARQYILIREAQAAPTAAGEKATRKEGSIEWVCETRIPKRFLPSVCNIEVNVSINYDGALPHNPMYK